MNYMDITGKTVLITGASRGIGKSMAEGMAAAGAIVYGTGSRESSVEWMAPTAIKPMVADARDENAYTDLIAKIRDEHGRLDVLINNAGIASNTPAGSMKESEMEDIIAVNFKGVFRACQAYYKAQRKGEGSGGNIINISSILGQVGFTLSSVYSGTKGAVIQLTRSLAVEWVGAGFRLNAICPGFIETDMTKMIRDKKSVMEQYLNFIPMKRMGRPEDLIGAAIFLASDASSYMTGQLITVDGGITAT